MTFLFGLPLIFNFDGDGGAPGKNYVNGNRSTSRFLYLVPKQSDIYTDFK